MTEQAFQTQGRGGNRIAIIVLGTVGVFLIAGILFQVFRAKPGDAAPASPNGVQQRATQQRTSRGRIDAIVGSQQITSQDVAMECYSLYSQEVLEKMINRLIIKQACEKEGVTVLKSEVEQEIQTIAQKFKLDVTEWYKMLQAERGITAAQYQKDVIWPMLALRKLAGKEIEVTQDEIQQAFKRAYGPKVKARLIMLDNFKQADKIWQHLKKHPEQFEDFAQKYSIDPSTKPLGGVVPPIQMYSGNEKLWKAAFSLKKDEISSVLVLFGNKHVILKSEGFTTPVDVQFQDVESDLREQLQEQKQQIAVAEVFEEIKLATRVVNNLDPSKSNAHPKQNKVQQVSGRRQPRGTSPVRTADNVKPNRFPSQGRSNNKFNPSRTTRQ